MDGFGYQPVGYGDLAKSVAALGTLYGAVKSPNLEAYKFQHTLEQDAFQNQLSWIQNQATQARLAMEQANADRSAQKAVTDLFMEMARHGYTQSKDQSALAMQAMLGLQGIDKDVADLKAKQSAPLSAEEQKYLSSLGVFRQAVDTGLPAGLNPLDEIGRQQIDQFILSNEAIKPYGQDPRVREFLTNYLGQRYKAGGDAAAVEKWYQDYARRVATRADLQDEIDSMKARKEQIAQMALPQQQPADMSRLMPILAILGMQPGGLFGGQQAPPPNPFEGQQLLGVSDGKEVYVNPNTVAGTMTTSEGKEYAVPTYGTTPQQQEVFDSFNAGKGADVQLDPLNPLGQAAKDYMAQVAAQQQSNPTAEIFKQILAGGQPSGQPAGNGATMGAEPLRAGQLGTDVVVQRLMAESPQMAETIRRTATQMSRTHGPEVAKQYLDYMAQGFSKATGVAPELLTPYIMKHAGLSEEALPQAQF